MNVRLKLVGLLLILLACSCDNLERQHKNKDQGASAFFLNGQSAQTPPAGNVARGDQQRQRQLIDRPPMSDALLTRGEDRYQVFCSPCHGVAADGHGTVVARGFPQPPDFTEARLLNAPDRYFVDVIGNGYGQMYSYASRVAPADRWAIAAWIRVLQQSRHASLAQLPKADRRALESTP